MSNEDKKENSQNRRSGQDRRIDLDLADQWNGFIEDNPYLPKEGKLPRQKKGRRKEDEK